MARRIYTWNLPDRILSIDRPLVMGIVNVTPDSFSDGGLYASTEAAVEHGCRLVAEGADILDIGGESTRPGATPVLLDEELRRVLPVVERLATKTNVPLSIDSYKAAVAEACLKAGASIVNDITGLSGDPAMPAVVRDRSAAAIVMHMQGTPQTMQLNPCYGDVVAEIAQFFEKRLQDLANAGIPAGRLVLDPGIGFGKRTEHNLTLIARLEEFHRFGRPICLGVSRKGFVEKIVGGPDKGRLMGSLAVATFAVSRGTAQVLRVHDVQETRGVVTMLTAIGARGERGV
jgi:dihydropteroate synthase